MRIDLLRHGACEGGHIFRGQLDVPLTEAGWQHMQKGLLQLQANWQVIVTSPKVRCRAFAEQLSRRMQLPLSVEPGVREIGFGRWEGQSVERVWREDEARVLAWSRAPEHTAPPGGESYWCFRERVKRALTTLAQQHPQEKLLLVTHGGVIKLLLAMANELPPAGMMQLTVGYGFAASLEVEQAQWRVIYPEQAAYVYRD